MKSKWIITCACLAVLGSTLACAGDEEAKIASDESAGPISGSGEGEDSKAEDVGGDGGPSSDDRVLTNGDCFPSSIPDSASMWAKACVGMANAHPEALFPASEYRGMPEDCKPFVKPMCRR